MDVVSSIHSTPGTGGTDTLLQVCGQLAPLSSLFFYAAPIPDVLEMRREKHVEAGVPLLPYTTMVMSNFLWVSYACLRWSPKILLANGTGLALGSVYFVEFLRVAPAKASSLPGTVLQHVQALALTGICISIVVFWGQQLFSGETADILGSAGVLFSVTMFASPLAALKTVFESQSARTISLPFTLASILNNALWGIVGYWDLHDRHIVVQTVMGLMFGLIQLAIKIWYGDGPGSRRLFYQYRNSKGINSPRTVRRTIPVASSDVKNMLV